MMFLLGFNITNEKNEGSPAVAITPLSISNFKSYS